nr:MAG TPA: ParB protein [Caudoviricetes sp.]
MGKKQTAGQAPVRVAVKDLPTIRIDELVPYANNAKIHGPEQIEQLRRSLREFGFVSPVLIDEDKNLIAGHGRVEAARAEGMTEVPYVTVSDLTEAQRRAYIIADNRLAETGEWDAARLKFEMEELSSLSFDTALTGFTMDEIETIHVSAHERAKPAAEGNHFWGDVESKSSEDYEKFVDKFKPKLTTDDCYTPQNIYEVIRDWAVEHYGLQGAPVIRPFYPGGDYEHETYPDGCVVIDNPPFSILSQICRFYAERGIRFFLFAPALTLFSIAAGTCNYLPMSCHITYENGADVRTSFVTNLGDWKIETVPELWRLVDGLNAQNTNANETELPGYTYPDCVMTPIRIAPTAKWITLRVRAEDASFIRALDAQRDHGKTIYGTAFLLSEKAAAEKAAAEQAAAEQAAAKKAAAEKREQFVWALSDREKEIVAALGQHDDR